MISREQHWNNIYKTKGATALSWYQACPDISLELFSNIAAESEHGVIDIGCGTSTLVDHLSAMGFTDITLMDLSDEALSMVKSRLGKNAGNVVFLADDVTKIVFKRKFDIWHDRAVFHFLTTVEDRWAYMSNLANNLTAKGHAIIGTFSLSGPERCSGLDIVRYDLERMKQELVGDLVIESVLENTHNMPSGKQQQFNFFVIKHNHA